MNDEIQTTDLRKTELSLGDAGLVDLAPDLDAVGFASCLNSLLVVLEVNKGSRQLAPVGDAGEEDLGSLVVSFLKRFISGGFDIGNVGSAQEIFKFSELVSAGIAESQRSIDGHLAQSLAGHAEELDQILVLACVSGNLDDLEEVGWILGADVGFDRVGNAKTIELGFGYTRPNCGISAFALGRKGIWTLTLRCVNLLGEVLSAVDADNVVDENTNSVSMLAVLLVDREGLIVHADFNALLGDV